MPPGLVPGRRSMAGLTVAATHPQMHLVIYQRRQLNRSTGQLGYSSRSTLEGYLSLPECRAALDTIAWAEGANYNTIFGGGTFSGNQHPDQCIPYRNTCSTAAGRYQFLYSTWRGIANRLGLTDFSPHNQDIAALALIEERGELAKLIRGDFEGMLRGLGCLWASLPYSGCGQNQRSLSSTLNYYRSALAVYGGANVPVGTGGDTGGTGYVYDAGNLATVDVSINDGKSNTAGFAAAAALAVVLLLT
jgi:muramidase (phage lysozyme)